jgi:hypothetical protein
MIGKQHKLVRVRSDETCDGCFFDSARRYCPRHKGSCSMACTTLTEAGYTEFFKFILEVV